MTKDSGNVLEKGSCKKKVGNKMEGNQPSTGDENKVSGEVELVKKGIFHGVLQRTNLCAAGKKDPSIFVRNSPLKIKRLWGGGDG